MAKINILPLRHWWQIAWHTPSSAVHSSEEDKGEHKPTPRAQKKRLRNLLHLVWQTDIMEKCVGGLRPGGCLRSRFLWYVRQLPDSEESNKITLRESAGKEGERETLLTRSSYWPECFPVGNGRARSGCLHLNMAHMLTKKEKKITSDNRVCQTFTGKNIYFSKKAPYI